MLQNEYRAQTAALLHAQSELNGLYDSQLVALRSGQNAEELLAALRRSEAENELLREEAAEARLQPAQHEARGRVSDVGCRT